MDYVHIENLVVRGTHGVMPRERVVEQEFSISLRMEVGDTSRAAESDELQDAVDYAPIRDRIVSIIENNSFYLIERLANTIAQDVLNDTRIRSLTLTIRKPQVWDNGVPGITIERTNRNQ